MKKVILILCAIYLLTGCNSTEKQNKIKIAAILCLTGDGAEYGQDELNAIKLVKKEIETNKNLKYSYDFIIQDSKSQPTDAVNAFQNLLSRHEIDASMSVLSSVCLALVPISEGKNIPIFCVGANPHITENKKLVFRSLPTTDYQAKVLAKTVFDKMDIDSIAILYLNDDFGNGSRNSFKKMAGDYKKTILTEQAIQSEETDYRTQITKILSKKPKVIYLATYGNSIATALIQLKELGYNDLILSTLEIAYPKVLDRAKNAAEGVIFTDTYFDIEKSEFLKKYVNEFKKQPSLDAVLAYDEANVIISTFEKYGINPIGFENIKGLDTIYSSPAGNFLINSEGDFEYSLYLKQIKNGKPVILE